MKRYAIAGVGLAILLTVIGWIGWIKSNDPALYDKSFRLMELANGNVDKNRVLDAILSSKLAIADVGRLRSLTSHYDSRSIHYEESKAEALARILMACSRPDLIGKEMNLVR
jgi:hypothetical protein